MDLWGITTVLARLKPCTLTNKVFLNSMKFHTASCLKVSEDHKHKCSCKYVVTHDEQDLCLSFLETSIFALHSGRKL